MYSGAEFAGSGLLTKLLEGTGAPDIFARDMSVVNANIAKQIETLKPHLDIDCDLPGAREQIIARARANYNFNGTKLGWHKERVEALKQGERIAPVTMDMALTQWCNKGCRFCYAGLQQNPLSKLNWDQWARFLDDCVEIGHRPGEGVRGITLISDGESTGSPYFLPFVRKAKENGIDVAVGTNGLPIKDADIPELARKLTYIRFNMNAADADVNAQIMDAQVKDRRPEDFSRLLGIISGFVAEKRKHNLPITIGLQQVLMPWYFDQVIPLALLGRELGVDYTVIKHCSDDEKGRLGIAKHYPQYKSLLAMSMLDHAEALSTDTYAAQAKRAKMITGKDRSYTRCDGTPILLQISGSGVVAPCGSWFNPRYKQFHIGYLQEQTFKDMWASKRYADIMAYLKSDKFNPCGRCAELCHQHHVNEDLFADFTGIGEEIPDYRAQGRAEPRHVNFLTS